MDTEFEVKKLKDLVKKLEKQNQHLRYKTGKLGPGQNTKSPNGKLSTPDDVAPSNVGSVCDDPYMKKIPFGSETLWLFTLGAGVLPESGDTLENWLRHDLDYPHTASLACARSDIMGRLECIHETQMPLIENNVSKASVEITSNIEEMIQEDYKNEFTATPVVHHMPLPSHTMTSIHGLIESESGVELKTKSPSLAHRSVKHSNNRMSHSRDNDDVFQRHRRRSPSPSHRSPSRSSSKAASSYETGMEKKSLLRQIPRTSSPARTVSLAKEDAPSRNRRGIPTLYQNSPRNSKLPSSTLERRLAVEAKLTNAGEHYFSQSSNLVASDVQHNFQADNDKLEKTSFATPNRRLLPRPSHASRAQYSKFNSKYSKEHSPPSSMLQQPSPAQSSDSLSETSDVWKDGEFF